MKTKTQERNEQIKQRFHQLLTQYPVEIAIIEVANAFYLNPKTVEAIVFCTKTSHT